MKAVVLIIDGLGDLGIDALGGRTPLEAAQTPVMDRLASAGRCGLIDPIGPGETPSTNAGVGTLMGIFPTRSQHVPRGPVEAAGAGIALQPGDVALRANLATLEPCDGGFSVLDRRAGRISRRVDELLAPLAQLALGDGVSATVQPTHQHRAVVVMRGPGLAPEVGDTDPLSGPLPAALRKCVAATPAAQLTAAKVNRLLQEAYERLHDHPVNRSRVAAGMPPANGLLTRGAGSLVVVGSAVLEAGLQGSVISGCNTVKGLGMLCGFDVVSDDCFTGDMNTDLDAKVAAAIDQLRAHEIVFVHIKAPDIFAHDRQPRAKRDYLEKIDAALAPLAQEPVVIAIAADHTTDSNTGRHTDDPVPALLFHPDNQHNGAQVKFGESACRGGNLQRQLSNGFLLEVITAIKEAPR